MPYIPKADRDAIKAGRSPMTAGELNYALTDRIIAELNTVGLSYAQLNAVIGALEALKTSGNIGGQLVKDLQNIVKGYKGPAADAVGAIECCKLELYRRCAVNYENNKIAMNTDVYPDNLSSPPDDQSLPEVSR